MYFETLNVYRSIVKQKYSLSDLRIYFQEIMQDFLVVDYLDCIVPTDMTSKYMPLMKDACR